jgi:hypothetical protein
MNPTNHHITISFNSCPTTNNNTNPSNKKLRVSPSTNTIKNTNTTTATTTTTTTTPQNETNNDTDSDDVEDEFTPCEFYCTNDDDDDVESSPDAISFQKCTIEIVKILTTGCSKGKSATQQTIEDKIRQNQTYSLLEQPNLQNTILRVLYILTTLGFVHERSTYNNTRERCWTWNLGSYIPSIMSPVGSLPCLSSSINMNLDNANGTPSALQSILIQRTQQLKLHVKNITQILQSLHQLCTENESITYYDERFVSCPFILLHTSSETNIWVETSRDGCELTVKFDNVFEIRSDVEIICNNKRNNKLLL